MYPRKTQWFDRYVSYKTLPGRDYPVILGFEPSHEEEMLKWFDPYMLRRTKAEIIPSYQGKLPVRTIEVEMGGVQKKAYKQMQEHMLVRGEDGILAAPSPIEQLLRLNQFAAATPEVTEVDGEMKVTALKTPSCKAAALLEVLEELGTAPAVVFAESRLLIDLMAEVLEKAEISYISITGGQDSLQRKANIDKFQGGNARVALCTYGAGAESITLNRADTVIRLQRSYNFVSDTQAPDRVDRGERTVPVQVIDIVTQGTTEAAVHTRVGEKAELFQQVVRDALEKS
jgi:SNF2 family DNA or RNA helicase